MLPKHVVVIDAGSWFIQLLRLLGAKPLANLDLTYSHDPEPLLLSDAVGFEKETGSELSPLLGKKEDFPPLPEREFSSSVDETLLPLATAAASPASVSAPKPVESIHNEEGPLNRKSFIMQAKTHKFFDLNSRSLGPKITSAGEVESHSPVKWSPPEQKPSTKALEEPGASVPGSHEAASNDFSDKSSPTSVLPVVENTPEWTYAFDDGYKRKVLDATAKLILKMDNQDAADFVSTLDPMFADELLRGDHLPLIVKGIIKGKSMGRSESTVAGVLELQKLTKNRIPNQK